MGNLLTFSSATKRICGRFL